MTNISPSIDGVTARNNTLIDILIDGARVGRVQSFREDVSNNVQVLAELGRAYMVELKKGITSYSFTISRFYTRSDVFDSLKKGKVFGLSVADQSVAGNVETLEHFDRCMIQSISSDYTVGQASVGQNATVVVVGQGVGTPT